MPLATQKKFNGFGTVDQRAKVCKEHKFTFEIYVEILHPLVVLSSDAKHVTLGSNTEEDSASVIQ